jgi:hypothetical protein
MDIANFVAFLAMGHGILDGWNCEGHSSAFTHPRTRSRILEEEMADKLFRVYVRTLDHAHISEMMVAAPDSESAASQALGHVKATNPEKGRSLQESQRNSVVVAVREAGKNGCIVTNRIPVAIFEDVAKALEKPEED